MPNYCENDLFVTGNVEGIKYFLIQAINIDHFKCFESSEEISCLRLLDFNQFLPKKIWGAYTKWNAINVSIRHNYETKKHKSIKNGILIKFETAWTPPLPVITAMANQFPNLKFVLRYYEMGERFKGRYSCQGSLILCNRREDYHGNRGG